MATNPAWIDLVARWMFPPAAVVSAAASASAPRPAGRASPGRVIAFAPMKAGRQIKTGSGRRLMERSRT
jgi:hypothetical protein